MKVLDVGCGHRKEPGGIGIDIDPRSEANILHDLNRYPYPFRDNTFDRVILSHIIEHLDDIPRFLREIHRVTRPGGIVEGVTPHFSNRNSYADPTHRHHLSVRFLEFFTHMRNGRPGRWGYLVNYLLEIHHPSPALPDGPLFDLSEVRLSFARALRWAGVALIASRFPDLYESYLAFLLPAQDIHFRLVVSKGGSGGGHPVSGPAEAPKGSR